MTDASIGNFGKGVDNYTDFHIDIVIILHTGFIGILFISSIIYRNIQLRVIKRLDDRNITPSDYTVMATNLPLDKNKEQIKAFLKSHFEDIEIESITLCYDIKDIIASLRKLDKLK
jgi:hypothetical protein